MKEETKNISLLANQIQSNQLVYEKLPYENFEEHIARMIERLKVLKDLFIKEIAKIASTELSTLASEENTALSSYHKQLLDKYDESISSEEVEGCIALLIEIEENLLEKYHEFLFQNSPNEITKMILKNQVIEVKRDIHILKNLYDYA